MKAKKRIGIFDFKGSLGVWKEALVLVSSNPKIFIPFLALAVVESIALWVLSCSPHFPFNYLLAPPIRSIWGRIWLHYPYIYELLPKLFYYAKMVVGVFAGSVASGVAVLMVARARKGGRLDLKEIFLSVIKRYVTLCVLAIALFSLTHFVIKQPQVLFLKFFSGHSKLLFLGPKFWLGIFTPVCIYALAVILQGIFVYSFPFVVIKEKKFLPALFSSIALFSKKALKTLAVVLAPMLLYIPIIILRGNIRFLADKFFPEITVAVLFLGILVSTLVVDLLIVTATTLIFLEEADEV